MTERDNKALNRIIHHIESIETYMSSISSLEEFTNNSLIQDAVVFNLLQIGEIAKTRVSDKIKKQYPSIPWKKIYGFRNRLVHDYTDIILDIVYETIIFDLHNLYKQLSLII